MDGLVREEIVVSGIEEAEQVLIQARREATQLAVALVTAPFAESTVKAARAFLSGGEAMRQAAIVLTSLPPGVLRARIAELDAQRSRS